MIVKTEVYAAPEVPVTTTTTTVPSTTTTTRAPIHIITCYGLWGPGGPTGAQFAVAGLSLLAGAAVLIGLSRLRRRKAVR